MCKIVVLFGSFNPLTNAHFSAMRNAVEHLDADKGLFVATSGKYLRKKALRIDDPFCLTEEERKLIIEQTCCSDDKLEFWGFEMGGITPKRYKTLCKIKKQYPDAEVYEIQGADKVRSDARFANAEEYIGNTHFVIFDRSDIDLDAQFSSTPVLDRYRDHFTVLPALENSGISSTEVRRRFYAGEDYSELVPEATRDVMSGYKPSDFSISYADRMKTIINSGRFGANKAAKEVYAENKSIFLDWKNGTASIALGDYTQFLDNTVLYKDEYNVSHLGRLYPKTKTGCINIDCVDLAQHLMAKGYDPAILNLASAGRPGGGYDVGMNAQEESLCQSSNLSLSLYQYGDPKRMKAIAQSGVPRKHIGYPLDMNFGGVYTPDVTFFRYSKSGYFDFRDTVFKCDVITVAALSFNGRNDFARAAELNYRAADGNFNKAGEEIMLNKIRTIFRMGVEHGKDSLILGAFGCGAYKLPIPEVVRLFRAVMEESEFKGKFRSLIFAIMESKRKPCGLDGKFADFYREFGEYTLS